METRSKGLTAAVIAAAGKGTRMELEINKQYIEILGADAGHDNRQV